MAMHNIDVFKTAGPLQVDVERVQDLGHARIDRLGIQLWSKSDCMQVLFKIVLLSKCAGFNFAMGAKLAGKELNVNTGTAIDVGRKFIGKKGNFHSIKSILIP